MTTLNHLAVRKTISESERLLLTARQRIEQAHMRLAQTRKITALSEYEPGWSVHLEPAQEDSRA